MLKRWDMAAVYCGGGEPRRTAEVYIACILSVVLPPPPAPPEGMKDCSSQQAMLEMNVHFISLCSKSFSVISHAHTHTRSPFWASVIVTTNTQSTCNMYITEYTLLHQWCFLILFFLFSLVDQTDSMNMRIVFSQRRIYKRWLLTSVPFCWFFFKLRYVSVKKNKKQKWYKKKKNCLCSCCKWCLLMSSGAVVDSVCSLDQTVLQGANLGDSGHDSIKISWAAVC